MIFRATRISIQEIMSVTMMITTTTTTMTMVTRMSLSPAVVDWILVVWDLPIPIPAFLEMRKISNMFLVVAELLRQRLEAIVGGGVDVVPASG
jgi:hypothetical protein